MCPYHAAHVPVSHIKSGFVRNTDYFVFAQYANNHFAYTVITKCGKLPRRTDSISLNYCFDATFLVLLAESATILLILFVTDLNYHAS